MLSVVLVGAVTGCADAEGGTADAGPTVVAAFYPLEYVAERIAGDAMDVELLSSPGVEPHDLELTVEQTATIADADLVFYEQGLMPAVDEAVAQNNPDQVVETTSVVPLRTFGELDEHSEEGEVGDHADDAEGDLHFWLDPLLLTKAAEALAEEMSAMDPEHREDYAAGYRALRRDLTALDRAFTTGLDECAVETVVVSHNAFGYWGRYGLDFVAINGLTPDAEPSPAHIAQLQDLIRAEDVTTVFSEELATPELADALAADLGLTTAVLDPVEGLSDRTSGEDYVSLMRNNLDALREANGCT
jgi:zinc transport system substrate-binding protein